MLTIEFQSERFYTVQLPYRFKMTVKGSRIIYSFLLKAENHECFGSVTAGLR